MVGLDRSMSASSLDAMIAQHHIGNMFFIGGWRDAATVRQATAHVQAQVSPTSTAGVRFLVAADQEGGQVQQLKGAGFTPLPSALQQGSMSAADRARIVAQARIHAAMLAELGWQVPSLGEARYPCFAWSEGLVQGLDAVLLSTEPYRFTQAHADALEKQLGIPVFLVDGEMMSWYGSRSLQGLKYLRELAQR